MRSRLVEIVIVGIAEAAVAGVATWTFHEVVGNEAVKDAAIVGVWLLAIGAGTLLMWRRWAPPVHGAQSDATQVASRQARAIETGVAFYRNRDEMNADTGGLLREVAEARVVWHATFAGNYAATNDLLQQRQFRRLLLLHPAGDHIRTMSNALTDETVESLRTKIGYATAAAVKYGVEVRWFDGPVLGMTFTDPDDQHGAVRGELFVPMSGVRPGFRVDRQDPMYGRMREAFDAQWEASVPAGDAPDPEVVTLLTGRFVPAWSKAMEVISEVRQSLRSRDQITSVLLQMGVIEPAAAAKKAVDTRLAGTVNDDLDPLVASMYEHYELLVRWIDQAGVVVGQPVSDSRRFGEWQAEDARFIDRLRDFVAAPARSQGALADARRQIEEGGVATQVRRNLAKRAASGRDGGVA